MKITRVLVLLLLVLPLVLAACRDGGQAAVPVQPTTASEATTLDASEAEPTAETVEVETGATPVDDAEPDTEVDDVGVEADMAALTALVEHPWQWVSFTTPAESLAIENPESYVLTFGSDGTVAIVADCNNAGGSYTVDGSSLTIGIGPVTLAACPPESRSEQFLDLLPNAAQHFFAEGQLFIDLALDGGTLAFAPAAAAEAAERAGSAAGSGLAPAAVENDEGGPEAVSGEWNYTSYVVASIYKNPVVALLDASDLVQGKFTEFVPPSGQILGALTSPVAPAPATFRVPLPIVPPGESVDLDNDGEEDSGVRTFVIAMSPSFVGDIYLEHMEQDWFHSYLTDPQTGAVREGSILIYAPDDAQGFPSAAGADGQYFTEDDPVVAVPAGYTVATLSRDGTVTFDRSREAAMDVLEAVANASPDFSEQGIVESYHSLIDILKIRYAYTELRDLDWEEIREAYLPQVQEADAAEDMSAYYAALSDMAQSIRDAHVQVGAPPSLTLPQTIAFGEKVAASLGVQVAGLDDGRYIVTFVDANGPGAQAGWAFGTEIVSVDGVAVDDYVASLPYRGSKATAESIRLAQLLSALRYPAGTTTTVEYRQPGESEVRSATLTAEEDLATEPAPAAGREEISFKELEGGFGYVQWTAFNDLAYKVAVFEKFIEEFHDAPGIVVDLRSNTGGNLGLLYTLASYFFTAEAPAQFHWLDQYSYDEVAGDLVKGFAADYTLSAIRPDVAYEGPVVVLVNEDSASAAEYFPQFLQHQGRALIVGEHSTEGAGGPIERVTLPGGLFFQYTKGRTLFAGTDELNLEGKGVTLDIDVPTTEENEQAKLEGRDPVLEAGLAVLVEAQAAARTAGLTGITWTWTSAVDPTPAIATVENPSAYTLSFGEDGVVTIQADCNQVSATYAIPGPDEEQGQASADSTPVSIEIGPSTLVACDEGSRSDEFLELLAAANAYQLSDAQLVLTLDEASGFLAMGFEPAE